MGITICGMGTTPQPAATEPAPKAMGPSLQSRLMALVHKLSRKQRLLVGLVIVLALVGWRLFAASQTATLKIQGQHSFRQAELAVWIDGDLAQKFNLTGSTRRHFGLTGSVQGSFAKSLRVPAGEHTIRIVVGVPAEGYEKDSEITGAFETKSEHTLYVNAERRGSSPSLSWRDGLSLPKPPNGALPGYAKVVTSFLFTIGGSMLSAVIGFLVQERLRAFKAKRAAARIGS